MKAMDIDCLNSVNIVKEAQQAALERDVNREIDEIYDEYLVKKNPVYPTSLEVIKNEEELPLSDKEIEARQRELEVRERREAEEKKRQQAESGKVTVKTLDELDHMQAKTIQELQVYDARQKQLQEKLEQQQRLISAVDHDIQKREGLLNYVFAEHASSKTSSLIISDITGTTGQVTTGGQLIPTPAETANVSKIK